MGPVSGPEPPVPVGCPNPPIASTPTASPERRTPPNERNPPPHREPLARLVSDRSPVRVCPPALGRKPLRTNADDRLPRPSLRRVQGGDGIVEGCGVADVRPQP